jgi:hypothetical protein
MVRFDDAHKAVHYPPDRRFRIWIRPSILIGIGVAILSLIACRLDRSRSDRNASCCGYSADISVRLIAVDEILGASFMA